MNNPIAKFIDGTMSSQSYIVVARKGKVVLGLKPLGLQDGALTGAPGKTYFFARLRSAPAGDMFDAEEAETGVAAIPVNHDFNDAWPKIKFNKKNSTRASGIFGAYLEGSLSKDPAKVLEQLENENFIDKMADAVVHMAGPENSVVRYSTLTAWLHEKLDPLLAKYKHQLKATAEFQQHVDANVGTYDFQQEILKEMLENGAPTDENDEMTAEQKAAGGVLSLASLTAAMGVELPEGLETEDETGGEEDGEIVSHGADEPDADDPLPDFDEDESGDDDETGLDPEEDKE